MHRENSDGYGGKNVLHVLLDVIRCRSRVVKYGLCVVFPLPLPNAVAQLHHQPHKFHNVKGVVGELGMGCAQLRMLSLGEGEGERERESQRERERVRGRERVREKERDRETGREERRKREKESEKERDREKKITAVDTIKVTTVQADEKK